VTPRFSVIVLNYNGRAWLEPCLGALATQSGAPSFEVLLVDNGSTDGSIGFVAARFPSLRIVDNGRNLGFAAGNNAAARAASGEILVFLNNDTVPASDWLARLNLATLATIDAPGRTLVTSRLVFLDRPETIDSAGDGYLRAGGAFKRGHGAAAAAYAASREVFGACGAAFAIERQLFERLGGFDDDFFMVYEDVDLSYRARLAGHACWYAADAVVRHAGSATLGTMSSVAVFHGQRNLEWTFIKNTPRGLLWRTLPSHLLYSAAGVFHYIARGQGLPALKGKVAALAGLPRVLAKRRAVQDACRVDRAAIERQLTRGWIAVKRAEKDRSRL
jgi:N-acetylglucosaminyl-diphospho-decaprenol L-rhamnosyltransferase